MVEGAQSPLQLEELKLKEKQSRYLIQFLRYRLEPRWTDDEGYVPWTVVKDKMNMSDQDLQSLVAHSVHHVKGCRFETRGEDDNKFIRARWSNPTWDPPQMEASPPSPPSAPPLAAGDLDQFREQLQELTQHQQELTHRCDAAEQENDKLRNQIGDMKKDIHRFKNWARVHMEEVVTAGVRSSSSNNSSNTWNGSNSWWTAGSGWDGSWWKDHSNVPWHVSK